MRQTNGLADGVVRVLFVISIIAITYGSLFPFMLIPGGPSAEDVQAFLSSWSELPSRGDILGNVALFIPFGVFGMASFTQGRSRASVPVFSWGIILAMALQIIQLWVRWRNPQLQDVIWNALGLALGMALASLPSVKDRLVGVRGSDWISPAGMLVGVWMLTLALPFVPSIDFAAFKESLKPLLLRPTFDAADTFSRFVVWFAIWCLLDDLIARNRRLLALAGLMAVGFGLQILMIRNSISLADALGALTALVAALFAQRLPGKPARLAAAGILVAIVWQGVTPAILRETPAFFYWIPFAGALLGDLLGNIHATAEKFFLYGAGILLLTRGGMRWLTATALVGSISGAVELMQVFLHSGTPEVTDPLMVLALGYFFSRWRSIFPGHHSPQSA